MHTAAFLIWQVHTAAFLRDSLLPDVVWPFIANAFDFALDGVGPGSDGAQEAPPLLRVSDAFVVKYNASGGQQNQMATHRDGALFSFNVALNELDEYEDGGTYFRKLERNVRSPKGHLLAHSSALMHGGHPTSSGVRYVLVAFCTIAPEYYDWASRFYEHVHERVDPGDEALSSSRSLPRGMLTGGLVYRQARQASLEGQRGELAEEDAEESEAGAAAGDGTADEGEGERVASAPERGSSENIPYSVSDAATWQKRIK